MKSKKFRLTWENEELISLYFAPTKDEGVSIGFTDPELPKVHLTIFHSPKDHRIHSHITLDKKKGKPYSQQIDVEFYNSAVASMASKWIVPASKLDGFYTPKANLLRNFEKITPTELSDGTILYPYELMTTLIKTDFGNKRRWNAHRSLKEIHYPTKLMLTVYNGTPRFVLSYDESNQVVICLSSLQYKRFVNRLSRLLGLDVYIDYLRHEEKTERKK